MHAEEGTQQRVRRPLTREMLERMKGRDGVWSRRGISVDKAGFVVSHVTEDAGNVRWRRR